MQTYDPSPALRQTAGFVIPGMRPAHGTELSASATPIYDALYSEYRRLFRALPGDRSGEEEFRFIAFGLIRPYGFHYEEQPWRDTRRSMQPEHTYGGHGNAAQYFAQQYSTQGQPNDPGTDAGHSAHDTGGSDPYGHEGYGQDRYGHDGYDYGRDAHEHGGQDAQQHPGQGNGGNGWTPVGHFAPAQWSAAGGRHRGMLSLPSSRTGTRP